MPNEFEIKYHPSFESDLKKLSKVELETFYKQLQKIKENPTRFDHMRGGGNFYKVRFSNLRLIYCLENKIIWLLIVERRDKVYDSYIKRFYALKEKYAGDT